ncbi:hypothetical protein BH23ACT3_BH23ACT3_07320 [soil metagenome]
MAADVLHPADIHRSLDDLAAQDLSTLCDAEIHELTMGLARAKCRVEGVLMAALDVWDSRQIWSDDGSKSPAARLAREANWSKSAASTAIRRARALRRLPVTAAAVTAGKMSAEFVDLVDHASTVDLTVPFSACEPAIVDGCIRSGYAESKDAINRWVDAADPDDAEKRAKKRFERRGLTAAGTIDGLVHLNGLLDAVGGHELLAELRRVETMLYNDDRATGRVRTTSQRRADALVEMARRSAALDTAETAAGKPARIVLSVVLGLNTFEHLCELADGTPMAPGDLVPHLHRTDIERIVFDTPDRVMSISRRRAFPAAIRRAVELRDRRCTHPSGCDDLAEWCDIDHVEEHSRGGVTSEGNARLQCRTHNRDETLHNRAPDPDAPRTTRPPRGWIPDTPNLRPASRSGDRSSCDVDADADAHGDNPPLG